MIYFGLDIGIGSVGWAVIGHNEEVLESGSNIFPVADAAKNVERRAFRQGKRLKRRRRNRVRDFNKLWASMGLTVPEYDCNKQLQLRVLGLTQKISSDEVYFVLANMLMHRGISYLEDAVDSSTTGKSNYEKGILYNEVLLKEKYPCEIQLERLEKYGSYRGETKIIEAGGEITVSNIFTTASYRKEIEAFLLKQKEYYNFITDEFEQKYIDIFNRKRAYYEGPGSELSRTDYGKYTTRINLETGEYVTEPNIFERLIGKCSVYPQYKRAAGASYTAQEFNLLNDLNNLVINGRKLEKNEKEEIVEKIKNANVVNVKKIIEKTVGEDIISFSGARIDKEGKELFHSFEAYRKIKKEFEVNGQEISSFSRDELDKIAEILTINTEKAGILEAFDKNGLIISEEQKEILINIRKRNGSLFNKWQSFSLEIMQELIPAMYEAPKNQMELLTAMGVYKNDSEKYAQYTYIPKKIAVEEIYNPVVRRAVGIAIDIVNALIKKYGYPDNIVIEMPRDRNSEEEKERITKSQRDNEKELKNIIDRVKKEYGIEITDADFKQHKKLALKLKLWNEQQGRCLYSGKPIKIEQLLNDWQLFEVDHIIPRSISYDDSRNNKVLVYKTENQNKGNKTPYMYLGSVTREWDFNEFMNLVLALKLPYKKTQNLLYYEDITKIEVLKGFIARNINDTRYASRTVLNVMQSYFKGKNAQTKVKVVKGSFTHQMRENLKLSKDREKSYAHHAVDAMLICYSQMGYEAYKKLQSEFIDFENEQILDITSWNKNMGEKTYEEVLYQNKGWSIRKTLINAEKNVQYWYKVDTKANRTLCNQTIRGTRNLDDKVYKVNKLNIYSKEGYKTLTDKIKNGKERELLIYRNDIRTFEDMMKIYQEYKNENNAFVAYQRETGDYFRKYSKKHDGPRIEVLKYLDGEVNSCIDISHKYGHEKNSRKVIMESLNPYRMDVFYNSEKEMYHFVGIKYADCRYENGRYVIDEDAYIQALKNEKLLKMDENLESLQVIGYEYKFSLYKNDIIEYEKNGEMYTERFLSRTMPAVKNYIETKPINAAKFEEKDRKIFGLTKTKLLRKIRMDILGNRYYCDKEELKLEVDNS